MPRKKRATRKAHPANSDSLRQKVTEIKKSLARIEKKIEKVSAGRPAKARKAKTRRGRKPAKTKKCSAKGCQKPARARGFCNTHYVAAVRKGKIKTRLRKKKKKKTNNIPDILIYPQ